jgi:hypothetical protein
MLIALYKETTSQRTERAAANLGRACEAVLREMRVPPSGGSGVGAAPDYLSALTRALEPFAGVEGGIWKSSAGSLAYAFPSYEGSGQKTDLPQAEEPAQAAPDPISKRLRLAHQGWTCDKPGSVEIGRSPLDSRAAAAIAGSGVRMGGTAW